MSKIICKGKVLSIQRKGNVRGELILTQDKIIFTPNDPNFSVITDLVRRVVQVGYKKYFRFIIPYRLYLRTKNGRVYYFHTHRAKKWSKLVEKMVY